MCCTSRTHMTLRSSITVAIDLQQLPLQQSCCCCCCGWLLRMRHTRAAACCCRCCLWYQGPHIWLLVQQLSGCRCGSSFRRYLLAFLMFACWRWCLGQLWWLLKLLRQFTCQSNQYKNGVTQHLHKHVADSAATTTLMTCTQRSMHLALHSHQHHARI